LKFVNSSAIHNINIGDGVHLSYSLVLNGTNNSIGSNRLPLFNISIHYNGGLLNSPSDIRINAAVSTVIASTKNKFIATADNAVVIVEFNDSTVKVAC